MLDLGKKKPQNNRSYLAFLGQRYERFGSGEKTNIKIDTCINHQAVVMLQLAKNHFEEVAIEANQPPSVISMNAQLIDEVLKYLEPNLDCDKLQKELEKK